MPSLSESDGRSARSCGCGGIGRRFCREAAAHIDEVLKGAKSANLPLEEAVSFELVINNRTARALGFTIPESLRQQADQ